MFVYLWYAISSYKISNCWFKSLKIHIFYNIDIDRFYSGAYPVHTFMVMLNSKNLSASYDKVSSS